jgi:hypothetical protein
MAVSLHELLQPQVILSVVSRIREYQGRLGRWLGFQPNRYDPGTVSISGANTIAGDTRYASWRIFDHTRTLAPGRAPGTGPATVPPNPVGDTRVACARFHMKVPMLYEELSNLSPIIGPNSTIDPGGQNYITNQERYIAQKFNNSVEVMATGMMQNSLYIQMSGDSWIPVLSNPVSPNIGFQINFQVPSGNLNQLNMLGAGNIIDVRWDNPSARIILHLAKIQAAFAQLTGWMLTDTWINSLLWYNIITNTDVRNTAGSVNTPFAEYENINETGPDGEPINGFAARLKGEPNISFHINNDVVVTNSDTDPSYATAPSGATIVKVVPDGVMLGSPPAGGLWTKAYHGGEYVVDNPGQPGVLRRGYYFWHEYTTQPSAVEMIGLLNMIPMLYVPKAVISATVLF